MAIGRKKLLKEAQIDKQDLREIDKKRRDYNRLGYAYQLTFVRIFNRMPATVPFEINSEIVSYVASRLQLQTVLIENYHKRRQTITEHQASIIKYLSLSRFDENAGSKLKKFIFNQSLRLEQSAVLETLAKQFLKEQNILEPAKTTISRLMKVFLQRRICLQILKMLKFSSEKN